MTFQGHLRMVAEQQLRLAELPGRLRTVFEWLAESVKIEEGEGELPPGGPCDLVLDNVSFRYPGGPRVLSDVSIAVPEGAVVAIVGESGGGKSTLGLLPGRLADPEEGAVRIGGVDVRKLTFDSLRRVVGYVPQDPFLLHDTILANIRLGDPGASEDRVVAAARAAGIHDFIDGLEDKYDTVVGAGGQRLSGGEQQRVVLARVLLTNPPLLVLDEATSALDNRTQSEVVEALRTPGCTTLVIAHRLSTVKHADQIHVLDGGVVVESGTHEELVALGGKYAELAGEQGEPDKACTCARDRQ